MYVPSADSVAVMSVFPEMPLILSRKSDRSAIFIPSALPRLMEEVTFMAWVFIPIKSNETIFDPELVSLGVNVILALVCADSRHARRAGNIIHSSRNIPAFEPTVIFAVSVPT